MSQVHTCPVCDASAYAFDVVDFNKSCEEGNGFYLPLACVPIYYFRCEQCHFCFAPEFAEWQPEDFASHIYNEDYIKVDPEYVAIRPQSMAKQMQELLGAQSAELQHLDYGSGSGVMSQLLREQGWQSSAYDPFVHTDTDPASLGKFNLITAFEVFEHVPDVNNLISRLAGLLEPQGIMLVSTLASDNNIVPGQRLNWWYAAPRNGHISLFSLDSLRRLGAKQGLHFGSFSSGFHVFWREVPAWANHLIK